MCIYLSVKRVRVLVVLLSHFENQVIPWNRLEDVSARSVSQLCPTLVTPLDYRHQAPLSMEFSMFESLFSLLWGIPLGVELLNHCMLLVLCLTMFTMLYYFPQGLHYFVFTQAVYKGFGFSTFSLRHHFPSVLFVLFCFGFDNSHCCDFGSHSLSV